MPEHQRRAIVLTVGTGNINQIEETVLGPLRKSIREGDWDKVVLLPSRDDSGYRREAPAGVAPVARGGPTAACSRLGG